MSASDRQGPLGGALAPLTGLVAPFAGFLRNWDYRPTTRWFEHFITVNWNSNDADVEAKVLGDVGSYGLQLSRVIDAVDLLVGQLDLASLTAEQQRTVVRLQDLAEATRRSVREYRGVAASDGR